MNDDLLAYYNRELSYVRKSAAQFAAAYPKIAARLRLGPDSSEDPHVERLIEAFAYLTARTRLKLDDDFPELTEAMLGVLYPHYQAPVPSMAVLQFDLDPAQNEMIAGHTLAPGANLETDPIQGEPCRFRTCYPVRLWPVQIRDAKLARAPFKAPNLPNVKAAAVVRLSLSCRSKNVAFRQFELGALRFFLKGQPQHVYPLYELLFHNVVAVALANSDDDKQPVVLDPDCIRPVGFERDDGMLPYPKRSFLGYRLLTEFFVFPDKFRFFEIAGLDRATLSRIGNTMEVFLYLDRSAPDLEPNVSADTFRLGCSPVVNLFPMRAEPVALTHTEFEYRVIPDARRPASFEVYSVDRVAATAGGDKTTEFRPFFSVKHGGDANAGAKYWHASRRAAEQQQVQGNLDRGTEVFLSLVDLDFHPSAPADATLEIETTCTNRDLPGRLPFGGDQPRLQLTEGGALIAKVSCLTAPTKTLRPAMRHGTLWRLVSHLSLNHLSLVDGSDGADALREILKLYDFTDSPETRTLIEGVTGVRSRRAVGRVGGKNGAVCRGTEVTLELDPDRFTGSGLFLFAAVMERFLALYSNVNAFSRLIITIRGRSGEFQRWPPRLGEQILL